MRARPERYQCPRGGRHHLPSDGNAVEPTLQQKPLMVLSARPSPSLDDQPVTLLLKRGHAVHRQYQRLLVEEQRIALDRLGGRLKIGARSQFDIDDSAATRRSPL